MREYDELEELLCLDPEHPFGLSCKEFLEKRGFLTDKQINALQGCIDYIEFISVVRECRYDERDY